jgi:hypothetical protein
MNNIFQISNNNINDEELIINNIKVNIKNNDEKIVFWEYGNRLFKIKNFEKKISKNLLIMHNIDKIFCECYNNSTYNNSYSTLLKDGEYNFNSGTIFNDNNIINVSINNKKFINKKYRIVNAGYTQISNIKISNYTLNKNKIPNLKSLQKHKDNISHVFKSTNILKLKSKYNIYTTVLNDEFNFDMFTNSFDNINKKEILKSKNNIGFYIKIYNNQSKAFYINNESNLIYYIIIDEIINKNCLNIRYYIFNTIMCKII